MEDKFISIGTVIIDDIVLPDGTIKTGILGGGVTHAAMGMRVWSPNTGLVAGVGADFDESFIELLQDRFDINGLERYPDIVTPRAWQVFEEDGTRNEVFQTDFEEMINLIPGPACLPDAFSRLSGVHLHCAPQDVSSWVPGLRKSHCEVILWEPWDDFCVPENQELFIQNSQQVDIVSPNLREGRLLTGVVRPEQVIKRLRQYGARMVVLRMAEAGSLVLDDQGDQFHIPPFGISKIVDVTGAGNAYCGGFIVGLHLTRDPQQAGWYGGVSASFALEQFGALYPLAGLENKAQSRLAWYRNHSGEQAVNKRMQF
jgi:sugar/nucleoside kinase (ribokinase family)